MSYGALTLPSRERVVVESLRRCAYCSTWRLIFWDCVVDVEHCLCRAEQTENRQDLGRAVYRASTACSAIGSSPL